MCKENHKEDENFAENGKLKEEKEMRVRSLVDKFLTGGVKGFFS